MLKYSAILLLVLASVYVSGCQKLPASQAKYIDTQLHLDGQYRSVTGEITSDYLSAAAFAVARMDTYSVTRSILMPTPQKSIDQPGHYADDVLLPVIEHYPDRFIFVAGGGTLNPFIQAHKDDVMTDSLRNTFTAMAYELIVQGAQGFGEIAALHLSLHVEHPYMEVAPDHELLLLLVDIAAEADVPLHLHMQAVENDMITPSIVLQNSNENPAVLQANIAAFERLLDHNPKATIVWQHAGWDVTGNKTPELLNGLLQRHPNLYLSIRVAAQEPFSVLETRPLDENEIIRSEWRDLISAYPDRFMIGADEFSGIPGSTTKRSQSLSTTIHFVEQLPETVQQQVGYANAAELYGID